MKVLTPVGLVLVGLLVGLPCPAQDLPPAPSSAGQAWLDTLLLGERLSRAREGADLDLEQKRLEVERQKLLLEQQQLQLQSLRESQARETGEAASDRADVESNRNTIVMAFDVLLLEHPDLADYGKQMDELAGLFAYGGKSGDFADIYQYLDGLLTLAKAEESGED